MEALDLITRKYVSALPVAISKGTFPRKYLPRLAEQMYLQEKWPSHIAHVYLNLDEHGIADRALIRYIISIIRAENVGIVPGAFPTILWRRALRVLPVCHSNVCSVLDLFLRTKPSWTGVICRPRGVIGKKP